MVKGKLRTGSQWLIKLLGISALSTMAILWAHRFGIGPFQEVSKEMLPWLFGILTLSAVIVFTLVKMATIPKQEDTG